jgi:hypothetical protein
MPETDDIMRCILISAAHLFASFVLAIAIGLQAGTHSTQAEPLAGTAQRFKGNTKTNP